MGGPADADGRWSPDLVRRVPARVHSSPIVYFMAIIAFLGWFFFVMFVGIGLSALPMDLLYDFTTRPQTIDLQARTQTLRHNPDRHRHRPCPRPRPNP